MSATPPLEKIEPLATCQKSSTEQESQNGRLQKELEACKEEETVENSSYMSRLASKRKRYDEENDADMGGAEACGARYHRERVIVSTRISIQTYLLISYYRSEEEAKTSERRATLEPTCVL
jgi:hypothetical protein